MDETIDLSDNDSYGDSDFEQPQKKIISKLHSKKKSKSTPGSSSTSSSNSRGRSSGGGSNTISNGGSSGRSSGKSSKQGHKSPAFRKTYYDTREVLNNMITNKSTIDATSSSHVWGKAELQSLRNAVNFTTDINPTQKNYWFKIAAHVPGKSSVECHNMWFSQFETPDDEEDNEEDEHDDNGDSKYISSSRKRKSRGKNKDTRAQKKTKMDKDEEKTKKKGKLGGAGTLKRTRQLREHVELQNQGHTDDMYENMSEEDEEFDISLNEGGIFSPANSMEGPNKRLSIGSVVSIEESPGILKSVNRNQIDVYIRDSKIRKKKGKNAAGNKRGNSSNKSKVKFATPKPKRPRDSYVNISETTASGTILRGTVTPGGTAKILVERNDDSDIEYNDSFVLSDSE